MPIWGFRFFLTEAIVETMASSGVLPELEAAQAAKERRRRSVLLLVLLIQASLLILLFGGIEGQFGNTDRGDIYGSDAVQYLDIARDLQQHDFHSALNPLWSQGYPALLAVARPLFSPGPVGDWRDTRVLNFAIYVADYFAFLFLVVGLLRMRKTNSGQTRLFLWASALALFLITQICLGQVSHVNPDELVTTLFFFAAGLMVRILNQPASHAIRSNLQWSLLLGLTLGLGFIAKAVFLVLGLVMLAFFALALFKKRRNIKPVFAAAVIFAVITGSYGAALSRSVGHFTLGEAGSINYAWHVNRLQKWVHWQGGVQPAAEAWPTPLVARFAHWESNPPNFGVPIHPTTVLQASPVVYGFDVPFHATYVPYFNPPYFYVGYHHLFRTRYQLIALAKNTGDLAQIIFAQPLFIAFGLALVVLLSERRPRRAFFSALSQYWLLPAVSIFGIAIYLPVHLEGRYLAGFLTTLIFSLIIGALEISPSPKRLRAAGLLLILGFTGSFIRYQLPVWRNLLHHKSPTNNIEWLRGDAVLAQHLPRNAQVGVINWTPNLQSDWAYIAHVQITSEIASPHDMDLFWQSSPDQQRSTLATFYRSGTVAVIAFNKPSSAGDPSWKHLPNTDLWMYRF